MKEILAMHADPTMPVYTGVKAPVAWHEANFILGMEELWPIAIFKTVEREDNGVIDSVRVEAGYRGAVANGTRIEDDHIEWDEYDFNDPNKRLCDWYILPDT